MGRQEQIKAAQQMVKRAARTPSEARGLYKSAAVAYAGAGLVGLAAWCERQAAKCGQ